MAIGILPGLSCYFTLETTLLTFSGFSIGDSAVKEWSCKVTQDSCLFIPTGVMLSLAPLFNASSNLLSLAGDSFGRAI